MNDTIPEIKSIFAIMTETQKTDTYEVSLKVHGEGHNITVTKKSSSGLTFSHDLYDKESSEQLLRALGRIDRELSFDVVFIGKDDKNNYEDMNWGDYVVVDIYDNKTKSYLPVVERQIMCAELKIPHVKIIKSVFNLSDMKTVKQFCNMADVTSIYNPVGEGIVFKSRTNSNFRFQCTNLKFNNK